MGCSATLNIVYAPTPKAPTLLGSGLPSAILLSRAQSSLRNGIPSLRYSTFVTSGRLQEFASGESELDVLCRTEMPAAAALEDDDDESDTLAAVVVNRISACLAPASLEFCNSSRYTAFCVA